MSVDIPPILPVRPSSPGPDARLCADCKRMKDDTGNTFGWGLCHCGSFRYPYQEQQSPEPK